MQAFVRAWNEKGQVGFGPDGTVDIERFRIYNPPVLVPDEKGEIVQEQETESFETQSKITRTRTLREDPKEALLQVIEHNLSVMKNIHTGENIVKEKRGNTTSTYYPNGGTGTGPVDGTVFRQVANESLSDKRSNAGTTHVDEYWYEAVAMVIASNCCSWYNMSRSLYGFNTSDLNIGPTKTIQSATLSIHGISKYDSGGSGRVNVVIDKPTPQSDSDIVATDYNIARWAGVEQATARISYGGWNTSGWNDFTLNSTGLGNINISGNTWFGTRGSMDFDNTPSGGVAAAGVEGYFADQTGTSVDPKLVIEHTSSNATSTSPTSLQTEGQTNPSNIADSTPDFSAIFEDPDTTDLAIAYQIQVATTSDFSTTTWDSTKTTLASSTPQGARIAEIGYAGSALASSTTYYWRIKFWDYQDRGGAWSTATSTFSLAVQAAPDVPTGLLTEGQTNPTTVTDTTPEFSAIYQDTNSGDVALHYRIQVSATSTFATTVWDTLKTTLASSTPPGSRIADISYAGMVPVTSTTYYWRIKFWDNSGFEGSWSTTTSTFLLSAPSGVRQIQHISFTYDTVGNIQAVTDISETDARKTIVYQYDDLYRLTNASTTVASSTPFLQTYTYNSIGNITNKSDVGAYTYGETGYTNPHAPTQINGVTHVYDQNGNVTNSVSTTNVWDYKNRLNATYASSSPSTYYQYDHTLQRVGKGTGVATTTYPNKYYSYASATTTKYIFTPNGEAIATIVGSGATTSKVYIHGDNLGGTNVVTDEDANVAETLDYYPYGGERINSGDSANDRHFIGERFDSETSLSYLNARYYGGDHGQFISQDPVFWELRQTQNGIAALRDPQSMNSYSYAKNNPLVNKDPSGRWWELSASAVAPGRVFSAGLRFDSNGFDYFVSGGVGGGWAAGAGISWTPGELSHQREANINMSVQGSYGIVGGRLTQNLLNYDAEEGRSIPNGDPSISIGLGVGGGAGIQQELSAPVPNLVWGKPTSSKSQMPLNGTIMSSPSVNMSNIPKSSLQNFFNLQSSQSTPSTLPSSVIQNGVSYTRNVSGLLNFAR